MEKKFTKSEANEWIKIDFLPGVDLAVLAEPVPEGSIHKANLAAGTVIPIHTHPVDEYVLVLAGEVKTTGGETCKAGDFWHAPAGLRQGPHEALSDVELLTVRLGAMGEFESS